MDIQFRKLNKIEHDRTRALWEDTFVEDTKAFLDYYYKIKTAENEMFVAEDMQKICAMLQLNPYRLRIGRKEVKSHYIIAVATNLHYRKRGLMAQLLRMSMQQMHDDGEPFTFLMPAAEAIYYPFDFRYVYAQTQGVVEPVKEIPYQTEITFAGKSDCAQLSQFAAAYLEERYHTYAIRDVHYYETVLEEQKSEQGGILLVRNQDGMVGSLLYTGEGKIEIREPMFLKEHEELLGYATGALLESEQKEIPCYAAGGGIKKPLIMARILNLEAFFACMTVKEDLECDIFVEDSILEENNGLFHLSAASGAFICAQPNDCAGEGDLHVPAAALSSFLFGYKTVAEAMQEEKRELSEDMRAQLEKIVPISPIFLNEIV